MDDYISRETAIMAVGDYEKLRVKHGMVTPEKAETVLIGLPAADVVEVKHGYWAWVQYDANPEIGNFHCSLCYFMPAAFNLARRHLNYCPNCGAKMED